MSAFPDRVIIRNARQHNLKGITVELPRRALTVITGPSGSGKSSLAFDTLYAEGQRRYVESLSTYARQFLERVDRPDVDTIDGLPPAIAIQQKGTVTSGRSTVGTSTEINDFLRILRDGVPLSIEDPAAMAITKESRLAVVVDRIALPATPSADSGPGSTEGEAVVEGTPRAGRSTLHDLRRAGPGEEGRSET